MQVKPNAVFISDYFYQRDDSEDYWINIMEGR